MPFFREVLGFHNWVYYAYLDNKQEVKYMGYKSEAKTHTKGGKVSYNLHQGDQRKYSLRFFIIIKWEHMSTNESILLAFWL